MIYQQWVDEACGGKPGEAARRIEAATGQTIGYSRAHRWYRSPTPLSIQWARLIVKASKGACTLDELLDPDIIVKRFRFDELDARAERRFVARQLSQRERDVKQLEAAARLGLTLTEARAEVQQLRAKLDALGPAPKRTPRPRAAAASGGDGLARKRTRRRAAPAAAA